MKDNEIKLPEQEQQLTEPIPLDKVFDKEMSVEDLKDTWKKGLIAKSSHDEKFNETASDKMQGHLLEELDKDKKITDIQYDTDEIIKERNKAKEYYDYHNTVLRAVGIETPLSIKQMKFWAVIGSIYYFIQRFIFFNGDLIKTITDAFTKVVKTFFETLADILKSSSKAVKGFGYMLIAMCFIFAIIGVIYIIPKLIGIDIFELIKNAIKK